ncbi:DNA processing protein DprA [Bacteroidia bacterium]|nr:DNA processing protein DprA [Bacteroidia bacterium]
MTDQNLVYQIALTQIHGIGDITAKQVIEHLGDASLLFQEKSRLLEKIPGISRRVISEIHHPEVLRRAEREVAFIEKNKITPLFIQNPDYPERLRDCIDAPVMLYFKGNTDFNTAKVVSIVGTRHATAYGREITESLLKEIAAIYPDTLIISGLAYGIDVFAHRAALKNNLPTVGVLAHGLDRIYPPTHRNTAVEMLPNGGLLTDFLSETNPDRPNFVKRNRIVAGISDCTIVVESAEKGGALITANIAESYNKDVFAVPGKTTDVYSAGCNTLIKYKKAALITCAGDLFREMCWNAEKNAPKQAVQQKLFIDLSPEEQIVVDLLTNNKVLQLNSMAVETNLPIPQLASILFELEMKNAIKCLPGGLYQLK